MSTFIPASCDVSSQTSQLTFHKELRGASLAMTLNEQSGIAVTGHIDRLRILISNPIAQDRDNL
jgi:hypothetical protein